MHKLNSFTRFFSYFFSIRLKKYTSHHSGNLYVSIENGKKVLNTDWVNYSFNSLHKVFRHAFAKSDLQISNVNNTLILGLGGGSIVQILRENYSLKTPLMVIDIDPVVIDIAYNEFNITRFDPIEIIEADAYEYVYSCAKSYDIICVDLFINEKVPPRILAIPFIQQLLKLLHPSGSVYFNVMIVNDKLQSMFDEVYDYLMKHRGTLVSEVYYVGIEQNNRVLIVKR